MGTELHVHAESLDHDSAFKLLPWLAQGSLAARQRQAAQRHVRTCFICRRKLREIDRAFVTSRTQPTAAESLERDPDAFERALGLGQHELRIAPHGRFASLLRFVTVAAMGAALLGFLLWLTPNPSGDGPRRSNAFAPLAAPGAQVDLVFDQQATAVDIHQLLTMIHGEIVAGPSTRGRYGVRIDDGRADDAQIASVLERLANDARISLAQRSSAPTAP